MLVGVAEDDADIAFLLEVFLNDSGYDVVVAGSGIEALEMCRTTRPDVLLLDVSMPGELDGADVLRAVKADPDLDTIPVLMLTAHNSEQRMADALASGAAGYLIKPFSMTELVDLLGRFAG